MEGRTVKWSIGKKIASGFAVALAMLCALGVFSYAATRSFGAALDARKHSRDIGIQLLRLLNAEKDMQRGEWGYIITGNSEFNTPYTTGVQSAADTLDALQSLMSTPELRKDYAQLSDLAARNRSWLESTLAVLKERGAEAARAQVLTDTGRRLMDSMDTLATSMIASADDSANQSDARGATARFALLLTIVVGIPVAIAIVLIASILITRNIASPLRALTEYSGRLASGNLTVLPDASKRSDEVGELQRAVATMTANLRTVVAEISEGVNVVGSSSSEILATTAELASGAAETAAAVSETTTTVEEVKQTAVMASQKAKSVADGAQKSVQFSQNGKKAVGSTVEGMGRIREQMDSIARSIVQLSEQNQAIGEIIATVGDLAEQSNLLSVNAGIEAAKAGEQGRGFAVVAQEVKNLAEQSRKATVQVRAILGDVQKAMSGAVMATEQGGKVVEAGILQSADVTEAIRVLGENVQEASQASLQIAASSQQQLAGMSQIAQAMESIKTASAQNAAAAKQAETSVGQLHDLGRHLQELVRKYRL